MLEKKSPCKGLCNKCYDTESLLDDHPANLLRLTDIKIFVFFWPEKFVNLYL